MVFEHIFFFSFSHGELSKIDTVIKTKFALSYFFPYKITIRVCKFVSLVN